MPAATHKRYRALASGYAITKTGGAVTFPVRKGASGAGIITITTTSEVGTGSLQVAVTGYTALGGTIALAATVAAAITTETTVHYYFGCNITTAESPVTEAFINGLPENFDIVIDPAGSTSGADGFTVAVGVTFL